MNVLPLILALNASQVPPPTISGFYTIRAEYVAAYDGDTATFNFHLPLNVSLMGQQVRFCDINAPEIRPLKTRVRGRMARDFLRKHLASSSKIYVLIPKERSKGKFGRWLGYVYTDNYVNVNKLLLEKKLVNRYKLKCK